MKNPFFVLLVFSLMVTAAFAMTKADLIERIAQKSVLNNEVAKKAVDSFFDIVVNEAQTHDPGVALIELSALSKKQQTEAGSLLDEVGRHLGAKKGDVVLAAVIKPASAGSTIAGRKTVRPHDFVLAAKEYRVVASVGFGDGIRGSRPPD
jgi:nucleoid DNA-binding protein